MKLIKCNVENFGTLKGFSAQFTDGLCVIKEDNGFGKTTLATFLKAMFYGLPVSKKADLNENERVKFDPWQGGKYGGSVDFECEKGTYRIERFFGTKLKDDTFKLYNLSIGAESRDFSENIGLELFGIDAESFERSIFLPQQRLNSGMNASINAKLTGLVENSDDIGNFDTAMAELDKQQKTRGVKGRLDAANKEIVLLQRQISDCKTASSGLNALKEQYMSYRKEQSELETELASLRKNIRVASDMAAAQKDAERRLELENQIKDLKQQIETVSNKYLQTLKDEEIATVSSLVEQYNSVMSGVKMLESDSHDLERLESVKDYFKTGLPTEQEIAVCRENLKGYNSAVASVSALSFKADETPKSTTKKGVSSVVLALAILLAFGGIGLLFVNIVLGIALLSLGVILAGVSGFLVLKNMIFSAQNATTSEETKLRYNTLKADADRYYSAVVEFTSRYGDGEPQTVLETVSLKLGEYNTLKSAVDRKREKQDAEQKKADAIYSELSEFFIKLVGNVPQNMSACVEELKEDARNLTSAQKALALSEEKLKDLPDVEIIEKSETFDREAMKLRETEVGHRLETLALEISTLQARIDSAERAADVLQEISTQLAEKQEQVKDFETKLSVVQLTEQFLRGARDNLSSRYMTVLKNGFEKYTSFVYGDNVGEFMLDNSLNLNMQRDGANRVKDYFSEGYRDMLDICMRLALSDALYEGDKPMLILDDPFVNLDDDRVKNALSMLEKLAENRQIIYLTCHTSRMPN